MNTLRFGFEVETHGRTCQQVLDALTPIVPARLAHKPGPVNYWVVTSDSSIGVYPNCEIASRINPTVSEIVRVMQKLQDIGCDTNGQCGMHVHVSHPTHTVRVVLPKVKVWNTRRGYGGKSEYWERHREMLAYRGPISQRANNHVEVRVFNATLAPWAVVKNIQLVKRCVKLYAPGERVPVQNDFDPIYIDPPEVVLAQEALRRRAQTAINASL